MGRSFDALAATLPILAGEYHPTARPKIRGRVTCRRGADLERWAVRVDRLTWSWEATRESDGRREAFDGRTGQRTIGAETVTPDPYLPINRPTFPPVALLFPSMLRIWGRENDHLHPDRARRLDDGTVLLSLVSPEDAAVTGTLQVDTELGVAIKHVAPDLALALEDITVP